MTFFPCDQFRYLECEPKRKNNNFIEIFMKLTFFRSFVFIKLTLFLKLLKNCSFFLAPVHNLIIVLSLDSFFPHLVSHLHFWLLYSSPKKKNVFINSDPINTFEHSQPFFQQRLLACDNIIIGCWLNWMFALCTRIGVNYRGVNRPQVRLRSHCRWGTFVTVKPSVIARFCPSRSIFGPKGWFVARRERRDCGSLMETFGGWWVVIGVDCRSCFVWAAVRFGSFWFCRIVSFEIEFYCLHIVW